MSGAKTSGDQKPTISSTNHADNVGQRGGKIQDHDEEPNTGMRVAEGGNKVQGDDLEAIIPGKRGVETFDAEGEPLERTAHRGHDEDPEGDEPLEDNPRGAETFDIEGEPADKGEQVDEQRLVDRDEGNRRGDNPKPQQPRK